MASRKSTCNRCLVVHVLEQVGMMVDGSVGARDTPITDLRVRV